MTIIGILSQVRDLVGIFDTNDLSDASIESALKYGRGELYAVTGKTDWNDITHPLYYKAETLVHYFASFYILDRYSGDFVKANTHRERAKELALELKDQYNQYLLVQEGASGSVSGSRYNVVASEYKSFPLNEDAPVHKSTVIIQGD